MKWLTTGIPLLLRFVWQVLSAGLATAWMIVRPGTRPTPGLLRMRYGNLNEYGVTLMGCMITLTPGTTTIDIDTERGELLLHLLNAGHPERTVRTIRRQFETPLQRLFPARRST